RLLSRIGPATSQTTTATISRMTATCMVSPSRHRRGVLTRSRGCQTVWGRLSLTTVDDGGDDAPMANSGHPSPGANVNQVAARRSRTNDAGTTMTDDFSAPE